MPKAIAVSASTKLDTITQHIRNIPANDEVELRLAVHDLQQYSQESSQHADDAPIDHEHLLSACTEILNKNQQNLNEISLQSYRHKPYIRSLNALLQRLLPQTLEPQPNLCLDGLQLDHCSIAHIELPFSSFRFIDLSSSNLSHADLQNSDMYHINAVGCNFSHSNLSYCTLSSSDMSWADFSYTRLYHITAVDMEMSNSILSHANLSHAILSGSHFKGASLNHTDLSFSNLFGVQLHHCKLEATDLRGTGITEQRLHQAGMEVFQTAYTLWGSHDDCGGRNPLATEYYQSAG
jgi:uncharacterized protein YjbI with pentapeptide repeats